MSNTVVKSQKQGVRWGLVIGGVSVLALGGALAQRIREVKQQQAVVAAENAAEAAATGGPRDVQTVRAVAGTWKAVVHVTGELTPIRETSLSFKQPGRLGAIAVHVGDKVSEGQVLATLDPLDASAQAATASAMVRSAELDVAISEENERRSKRLFESAAISQTEYRGEQQRLDGARARLATARAQAAASNVGVQNTRLTAPFAGIVVQAPSAPGAVVMPGTPLFRIEDTTTLKLTATVHPADVGSVPLGAPVELEGARALSGKVTVVFPSVDAQTRRVPIHAEIPNDPASPVLAGIFVRAHVSAPSETPILKLPANALKPGSQDEVWVVRDGKATTTKVVFTAGEDGQLYVREGISATDDVILASGLAIREGDSVRPRATAASSGTGGSVR